MYTDINSYYWWIRTCWFRFMLRFIFFVWEFRTKLPPLHFSSILLCCKDDLNLNNLCSERGVPWIEIEDAAYSTTFRVCHNVYRLHTWTVFVHHCALYRPTNMKMLTVNQTLCLFCSYWIVFQYRQCWYCPTLYCEWGIGGLTTSELQCVLLALLPWYSLMCWLNATLSIIVCVI